MATKMDNNTNVMKYLNSSGVWNRAKIEVLTEELGIKTEDWVAKLNHLTKGIAEKDLETIVGSFIKKLEEFTHKSESSNNEYDKLKAEFDRKITPIKNQHREVERRLEEEFNLKIKTLEDNCPHPSTKLMYYMHHTNSYTPLLCCSRCGKTLKKLTEEEYKEYSGTIWYNLAWRV